MSKRIDPINLIEILTVVDKYDGKVGFTADYFENGYIQFFDLNYKKIKKEDMIFLLKRGCFLWEDPISKNIFIMLG